MASMIMFGGGVRGFVLPDFSKDGRPHPARMLKLKEGIRGERKIREGIDLASALGGYGMGGYRVVHLLEGRKIICKGGERLNISALDIFLGIDKDQFSDKLGRYNRTDLEKSGFCVRKSENPSPDNIRAALIGRLIEPAGNFASIYGDAHDEVAVAIIYLMVGAVDSWNRAYELIKNKLREIQVDLSGALLFRAKLAGVNLTGVKLSGADLNEADLSGATLLRANLCGANLSGVKLSGADLSDAKLHKANFSNTDLSGVKLSGATLYEADLSRADLSKADLSGAILNGAKVDPRWKEAIEGNPAIVGIGSIIWKAWVPDEPWDWSSFYD